MRHAPSMTALRAFEAVVRHGSLSAAARELCVTPAAISHRLRDLEQQGGGALVARVDGRFVPTQVGQDVLTALGDAFERIRSADALLQTDRPQTLRIVSSYSFAVLWLAPRLSRFQERHPDIHLYLEPSHSPLQQKSDVTILHARTPPEGQGWNLLFADRCAAVARADHPLFRMAEAGPSEVLKSRIVHIAHEKGPAWGEFSWRSWARALNLPDAVPMQGATVSAEHLAVDMVLAEESFALVSLANASRLIGQGRLCAMRGSAVATGCSYLSRLNVSDPQTRRMADRFLIWLHDALDADRS